MSTPPRASAPAGQFPASLLAAVLLALAPRAVPQDCPDADPILAEDLEEHIDILASDAFEGRGTGTVGERRAAAYIVGILEDLGLEPAGEHGGWFQSFPVPERRARGVTPEEVEQVLPPEPEPPWDEVDGEHPDGGAEAGVAHGEDVESISISIGESHDPGPVYDFPDGRNILALLPGSDPELARQVVVLGAHYDHVGKLGRHGGSLGGAGEIHNGADDNASGSALLLELAAALATCEPRPRRSVLFQWYSGEELGLLGSQHWVDHPTRPLEDVVAMINTDMVGRLRGGTLLVGGVGTSPGFPELARTLGEAQGLSILLDPVGGAPSDSLGFYAAGIPVLFLFTGVHADYHTSRDDAYKINGEGAERIARLARDLLLAVADADEPPPFTAAPGMADYWTPRVEYGVAFDPAPPESGAAARAAVVVPDGPAGVAGLREGDLVLSVDGTAPADVAALEAALDAIDDARTPKRLSVLRAREGAAPERLEVALRPEVR